MFSEALEMLDRNTVQYMIEEREQEILKKDQEILKKDHVINGKDQEIFKKDQVINNKDQEIEDLKKLIMQLKAEDPNQR